MAILFFTQDETLPDWVSILLLVFVAIGISLLVNTWNAIRAQWHLGNPVLYIIDPGKAGTSPLQGQIQFNPAFASRLDSAELMPAVNISLDYIQDNSQVSKDYKIAQWHGRGIHLQVARGTNSLNFKIDFPTDIPAYNSSVQKGKQGDWQVVLETLGATVKYRVPHQSTTPSEISASPISTVPPSESDQLKSMLLASRIRWGVQAAIVLGFSYFIWNIVYDFIIPFYQVTQNASMTEAPATKVMSKIASVPLANIQTPFTLDSLSGNGFGVVAKVTGTMEIGEHEVQIFPESIEVRSFGNCEPECPFINSVSFSLSKSGSQNFSIFAQGVPVPVLEKLHDTLSLFITLPSSQAPVLLKFNSRDQLAELRLTLEINGNVNSAGEKHQASWYTHAELFAMALGKLPVNAKNSDETTQAQNAVLEGRELELEQLLQSGVNTNIRYADGQTMLMHASNRGDLKMIKLLLANGADVNAKTPINKDGLGAITALHKALLVDAVNIVDELIKAGANPLAEANGVWTPLHYAAYRGATQSIRYLHQHKLNIDEPFHGARGSTPLMIAAEHAQVPTIQLLLELGADPKRKDSYGEDACGYAKFFKKPASMSALSCE